MRRISALAATALALGLAASPALAAKPDKAPDQAAAPAPRKSTAQERAQVAGLDPLARAAFWAREAGADPADAEAGLQLSQALRQMGKYPDAIIAAQQVALAHPANVEAKLEIARAHVGRGQGFYAVQPAREAQALAPRDWRIPSLLGVAYEQAQRYDEALAAHRLAVSLAPENPSAISNLALYYAAHGEGAQAETMLRRAAAKPGAPIAVRQNLALVLGLQGRLDEAERLARQDLPPETVANNMAWLRGATSTPASSRSWDDMRARP